MLRGRLRISRATGFLLSLLLVGLPATAGATTGVNDPLYGRQYGIRRIGAPAAWRVSQGKGVIIAIVDTGVNRDHEDLKANMSHLEYDAINDDHDAIDLQGHGTHVAGIAAAVTNNRKGVAGAAPRAKIMPIRAFGAQNGAFPADIADGVMWAVDHGAKVVNLSLGADIPIDPFLDDLEEYSMFYATAKGALVVVAAGNSALPYCADPAFNASVICVGASDERDRLARFSNYGARIDVVAPGTNIWSTSRLFGYEGGAGTSYAAPFVAGVGALLMSMGATNAEAAALIRGTAKDLGAPGYDPTYGFGRLDAAKAVGACKLVC